MIAVLGRTKYGFNGAWINRQCKGENDALLSNKTPHDNTKETK